MSNPNADDLAVLCRRIVRTWDDHLWLDSLHSHILPLIEELRALLAFRANPIDDATRGLLDRLRGG